MQRSYRKEYTDNLEFLRDRYEEMINNLRQALANSLDVQVIENFNFKKFHNSVKSYEEETEDQIFKIINLQNPNTKDLRLLLGLYKSTTDLTRISNTILKISRVHKVLQTQKDIDLILLSSFEQMGKKLESMFDKILDLFGTEKITLEKAKAFQNELTITDDYIDNFFKDITKILIKKIESEVNSKIQAKLVTDMLLVVRHMERIGDHLCDLSERILYFETGQQFSIN